MRYSLFLILFFLIFVGCQNKADNNSTAQSSIQEIKPTDVNQIVTDDLPQDTVNVAKLNFEEDRYDFGAVDEGEIVKHVFKFTNTGKVPLVITNAKSTCGCTVPTWPKEPIPVGAFGEIEVSFNTENKANRQRKPVTITANTHPAQTVVYLDGEVRQTNKVPPSAKN